MCKFTIAFAAVFCVAAAHAQMLLNKDSAEIKHAILSAGGERFYERRVSRLEAEPEAVYEITFNFSEEAQLRNGVNQETFYFDKENRCVKYVTSFLKSKLPEFKAHMAAAGSGYTKIEDKYAQATWKDKQDGHVVQLLKTSSNAPGGSPIFMVVTEVADFGSAAPKTGPSVPAINLLKVEKKPIQLVQQNLGRTVVLYGMVREISDAPDYKIIRIGYYGELAHKPDYQTAIDVLVPPPYTRNPDSPVNNAGINAFAVAKGTVVKYRGELALLLAGAGDFRCTKVEGRMPVVR